MVRIMGIDVGEKRIGVAVSDPMGWTAQGIGVVERGKGEWDIMAGYIREYDVQEIVVGYPCRMDGSEGKQVEVVSKYVEELKKNVDAQLKITYWDERLTTAEAERILLEADLSRRRRKEVVDKLAAAIMLQSFLSARSKE